MSVNFFQKRTVLGSLLVYVGIALYLAIVCIAIDWAMVRRHPPPPASQSQSN